MTDRELMQQALNALVTAELDGNCEYGVTDALRARLAQPEPEPVAWADRFDIDRDGYDFWVNRQEPAKDGVPLYTTLPQREWQGLTDEEIEKLFVWQEWSEDFADYEPVVRAIEAKLKEKNIG